MWHEIVCVWCVRPWIMCIMWCNSYRCDIGHADHGTFPWDLGIKLRMWAYLNYWMLTLHLKIWIEVLILVVFYQVHRLQYWILGMWSSMKIHTFTYIYILQSSIQGYKQRSWIEQTGNDGGKHFVLWKVIVSSKEK